MAVHLTTWLGNRAWNGYKGLNGDIPCLNDVPGSAFEFSLQWGSVPMKIRFGRQVAITGRGSPQLEWHKALLDGLFPLTIGGGSDNLVLAMFFAS